MIIRTFAFCAVIIAAASLYIKYKRSRSGDNYDAAELLPAIHTLAKLAENLENADALVCDLHACNPHELLRGFRTNWIGLDGKRRMIDFLANGRNSATAGLMTAAQGQRDHINAQIIELVRAMNTALNDGDAPALVIDAVGETVDETTEEEAAGEW